MIEISPSTAHIGRTRPLSDTKLPREQPKTVGAPTGTKDEDSIQPAGCVIEEVRFAMDSPVVGAGFELVWGFSCQEIFFGFAESSLFGAGRPFFVLSPAIRFPECAGRVNGPKR